MPRKKKIGQLDRLPEHGTIAFHIGYSIKDYLDEKAYFEKMTRSDVIAPMIRNILQFIKDYEPLFLRIRKPGSRFTSIASNRLSKREHQYIYTLIKEFRFFPSRSELLRFAVLFDMFLQVLNHPDKQPRTLPLFDYDDLVIEKIEAFEEKYEDFTLNMKKLKELYPERPEYKGMNEE